MAYQGETGGRYNSGAVILHWTIAALLIGQLYVGWTFGDMPRTDPAKGDWFLVHKTLGFLILLLSVVRLGWRIANPPPPLPAALPAWERTLARINHTLFYVILIGLPLSGWTMISAGSDKATTPLLGGLPWPVIPGLAKGLHEPAEAAHGLLVYLTFTLIILHVGAALKHQFVDRSRIANRMPPFGVSDGAG